MKDLKKEDYRLIYDRLLAGELTKEIRPAVTEEEMREFIIKGLLIYGVKTEDKKKVSKELGIALTTLYNRINKFNIDLNEILRVRIESTIEL